MLGTDRFRCSYSLCVVLFWTPFYFIFLNYLLQFVLSADADHVFWIRHPPHPPPPSLIPPCSSSVQQLFLYIAFLLKNVCWIKFSIKATATIDGTLWSWKDWFPMLIGTSMLQLKKKSFGLLRLRIWIILSLSFESHNFFFPSHRNECSFCTCCSTSAWLTEYGTFNKS